MKKKAVNSDNWLAAPDRIDELEHAFRTVPDAFRPVPFWFWNGDPTERKTVRAQILNMKAQGIQGVMPMPIYGLDLPYCEPAWYDMVCYAADVCAEQKMQLWLYDEFHCPSGTCAGRVLREHPEYNRTMLVYNSFKVRAGKTLSVVMRPSWMRYPELENPGEELFADAPPRIFIAQHDHAVAVDNYAVEDIDAPAGHKRFPGKLHRLVWSNPGDSVVTLHVFTLVRAHVSLASTFGARWATHEPGYLDVLNPAAVQAFLRRTSGGYDRLLKKYYGNVVPGMFTDEPGMGYGVFSKAGVSFPYTPALFDLFRKTYGYELRKHLVELVEDIGDFRRTRVDYRRLITHLFAENYSGQYARWCAQRNLIYTGHFCSEEKLRDSALVNGDLFTSARRMHIPGMDYLRTETPYDAVPPRVRTGRVTDENRLGGKITAIKTLVAAAQPAAWAPSSGAPANRARRVICEANGVPNWSVTLGDLKHLCDWLCAMGVNLINDNGVPFSVKDIRGCAGRSLSAPWWPWYRCYAAYTARLSWIMSAGRSSAGLAVLYPTTAVWAALDYKGAKTPASKALARMQTMMEAVTTCLSLKNCEYDFIFEDVLRRAAIRNKALTVPDFNYRILVLPAVETLDVDCFNVIMKFQRAGGRIVIAGTPPRYVMGNKGTRVISERIWCKRNVLHLRRTTDVKALTDLHGELVPDPVQIRCEKSDKVQVARRMLRDGMAVFMINHAQEAASVTISELPSGVCEEWSPETGRMDLFSGIRNSLPVLHMEPWESKLLVFRSKTPAAPRPMAKSIPLDASEMRVGGKWEFEPQSDNLLPFSQWIALDYNDIGLTQGWETVSGKAPWEELVEGRARTVLAPDIMAAYWLRMDITVTTKPESLLLYQDGGTACRVFVNGREISAPLRRQLWDPANLCFNLISCIRTGRNRIVLRVEPSPNFTQAVNRGREFNMKGPYPAPAVLAGDFIVTGIARIRKIKLPCRLRDGSWTTQGFPNFAGRGRYTTTFRVAEPGRRAWIKLPEMRDLAEVRVNGRNCGLRPWAPYLFEITGALCRGENTITIDVVNTFGNVLRKHYFGYDTTFTPAGLLGGCRLVRV